MPLLRYPRVLTRSVFQGAVVALALCSADACADHQDSDVGAEAPSTGASGDGTSGVTSSSTRDTAMANGESAPQETGTGTAGGGTARDDTTLESESAMDDGPAADSGSSTGGASGVDGLGPPELGPMDLDAPSHGGTITFQDIGAPGWYPSRRDPAAGLCNAFQSETCCLARHDVESDELTPWDEELILTLRGPLQLEQLAVYQPNATGWRLVSGWDRRSPARASGIAFHGDGLGPDFGGEIGTECLVDVTTDVPFACGEGSSPFCPDGTDRDNLGWEGSKLFVLLARMPHADATEVGSPCSDDREGNWWDAPWVGLSLGELVRSGAFSDCHCYAKNPDEWWLGDGCGQFNAFEVVNDNNAYRNLDVFSTNFFGYAGYVGEGPCGDDCDVAQLGPAVDLIDKGAHAEAQRGAVASPSGGPGAAFRRPVAGFRYFLILLDAPARTVQLAILHPERVPDAARSLLPALPSTVENAAIAGIRELSLPR